MTKFEQICKLIAHYVDKEEVQHTKDILEKILLESEQLENKRRGGKYTVGKYVGSTLGEQSKEKTYWEHMINRTNPGATWKVRPTYEGCSCSELFNDFQLFADWCQQQIGFGNKGWCLDKDLLFKGNKVYSEYTCVFVPPALNSLIVKRNSKRGKYLIGVYKRANSNTFIAQCQDGEGKLKVFYGFKDEISAFLKYKEFKESVIKKQAEKWKDQIDPRAYEALMNYQVEIDD